MAITADRWLTGIVDAAGTGGLLGHVEGRTSALVAAWIKDQPQAYNANGNGPEPCSCSAGWSTVAVKMYPLADVWVSPAADPANLRRTAPLAGSQREKTPQRAPA